MATHTELEVLDSVRTHKFARPTKKIHDGADVSFFLASLAYRDIMTFILQLNHAVVPRKTSQEPASEVVQVWELGSDAVEISEPIEDLRQLVKQLDSWVDEVPLDTGPRRFGNVAFRKWVALAEERLSEILKSLLLKRSVLTGESGDQELEESVLKELLPYLVGSLGSPQRLDYGSGHELSFAAFLAGLWKLGYFGKQEAGVSERGIVIGVFEPYLQLVRRVIKTYSLEPAGSHGVWGLDDNSFLPYLFGSAQLCPAIHENDPTPLEGSLTEDPAPSTIANRSIVDRERNKNMYFSAIGFIYDIKRGPFGEHSPMLYDISGIRAGWGKINKGMIKMYNAEVLSKFPVVQHFQFGSLFRWERDPEAKAPISTAHTTSQPLRSSPTSVIGGTASRDPAPENSTTSTAPWARRAPLPPVGMVDGVTRAPWASTTRRPPPPPPTQRPKKDDNTGPAG